MNAAAAIEVQGLGKVYRTPAGPRWAVRGLDLSVPTGTIYGLLGRNGAGKTTTLRVLLGLVRADEGRALVQGMSVPQQLPSIMGEIGSVVDGPRLHPTFSGRRNLEVLGRLHRISRTRIDETLAIVDLADRAREPLSSYSTGMRQRLAVAAALLTKPTLLILDEPTNGLDPGGVVALRDLLRSLNEDHGVTILLSSHQLTEVARLCHRLAIVHAGEVRAEGTPRTLLSSQPAGGDVVVRLPADIGKQAAETGGARLRSAGLTCDLQDRQIIVTAAAVRDVVQAVATTGVAVDGIEPAQPSLESVFLEVTGAPSL
jgi:ABC-2 type transport system ATP-binding protein